jgi:SAM-dependent methyltransferase
MFIRSFKPSLSYLKNWIADNTLNQETVYQLYLRLKWGVSQPKGYPNASWENGVLKTFHERDQAIQQVKDLGLHIFSDLPKNWDSLAALNKILKHTNSEANILDAGAEIYSVILPWLYLYGYRKLQGINLVFNHEVKRGPITYNYGDITQTNFPDQNFDAITCLSVIEHGVDLEAYFKEMSRLLKPGGILMTSTDYYADPIDTKNQIAYGVPIHIFNREEILEAFEIAKRFNLYLTNDINLDCKEKVVHWKDYNLDYTFIVFTMQKKS